MAVLGLRRKPGLIALTVFRTMPLAYRMHLGRLFGHTFLNLTHRGRRSGRLYTTALKTVAWDRATGEPAGRDRGHDPAGIGSVVPRRARGGEPALG